MQDIQDKKGITLIELLVALMVMSIVLSAVATLAFAMGSANDASDDTNQKQAQVRYATLKLSDLIKSCKLICGTGDNDLAIWRADDNDDGQIDPSELVYLEAGQDRNYLRLLDFPSAWSWSVLLSSIQSGTAKEELKLIFDERQTVLLAECSNVEFRLDSAAPQSRFVSLLFDITENEVEHQYQINAAVRGWAGHLLGADGDSIVSDDD
ncbi:MAG: PilW family protein [Planctomycetota bacterium]|jgi:prepilin-type N-terminal cleavage/methylation domain-containing protein